MTTTATQTTSAPAGQTGAAPVTPPAAGAQGSGVTATAPAPTKEAKSTTSILGDVSDPKDAKKADGEQGAQGGESKDGKQDQAGELEIKLPDGAQVDAAVLTEFKTVAKKLGLNGEAASELVSWQLQRQAKAAESQVQAWEKQGDDWAKELEKDPDFGGPKLAENVLFAKKALRAYGGESLATELATLGIGNHPGLVRFMSRIGRSMAEDNSGTGGGGAPPAKPSRDQELDTLYPSMNPDGSPKRKEQ